MSTLPRDPLLGRVLDGKYQIAERIGTGGMGAVYKAVHVSLGAPRAVKVMKRELADDVAFVQRFQNEARLAEGLRHPNLVALYDFGRLQDGTWYIVTEFVRGETLVALLAGAGKFSSLDTALLLGQIADGLTLAHRKGIIHRDISPDNIIVAGGQGEEPAAKLLDFGIAKDVAGTVSGKTGSSILLGKIGYASPEQLGLLPKGAHIDARTDVFSLAVVAFQMLTNELPWRRDSLQSYVHDVLMRPETELHEIIHSWLPQPWWNVFMHAFAREREARTPTMQALKSEMVEAARSVHDGDLSLPRTRTFIGTAAGAAPTVRTRWRSRATTRTAAAAVGLAVLGALVLAARARVAPRTDQPSASAEAPAATLGTAPPAAPAAAGTPASNPNSPDLDRAPAASRAIEKPEEAAARRPQAAARSPAAARPSPLRLVAPPPTSAATSAPTPAAAPAAGTLILHSTPEAAVIVDGQPRGRTPLVLTLSPGPHAVSFRADDGRSLSEEVDVKSGASLERTVRLPGFGSLSITSDVWVNISVDGGSAQQTPLFISRLAAGPHTLRASRPGYKDKTLEVEVMENDTRRLNITLEKQ
jgi:serine/threonine-protein kinase